MNKADLVKELSQALTKDKVEQLAVLANTEVNVEDIIELSFYPKREIAFRSAWVLEGVYDHVPLHFHPHLSQFIRAYPKQKNPSCQRHYTKIMACGITHIWLKNTPDELVAPLADVTFEWLIDPKTPVAVKVNCFDALYFFSERYDWIKEELKSQIDFLLRDGSAAIQNRGKRILARLKEKGRN